MLYICTVCNFSIILYIISLLFPFLRLIGYSFAFVVYGGALVRSSVRRHFPRLSVRQASTITFLGHDPSNVCNDLAAKPEVTLFYTSLYIVFVFILLTYSRPSNLPLTPISIGDQEWGQDIFSILRYVCVFFFDSTKTPQ